jgi:protein involved in polysaccharide export with SLBB domain
VVKRAVSDIIMKPEIHDVVTIVDTSAPPAPIPVPLVDTEYRLSIGDLVELSIVGAEFTNAQAVVVYSANKFIVARGRHIGGVYFIPYSAIAMSTTITNEIYNEEFPMYRDTLYTVRLQNGLSKMLFVDAIGSDSVLCRLGAKPVIIPLNKLAYIKL